jgi:hypothetical protein
VKHMLIGQYVNYENKGESKMVSSHDRNQAMQQILRPGARARETFGRRAFHALERLNAFNWIAFAVFVGALLAGIIWGTK